MKLTTQTGSLAIAMALAVATNVAHAAPETAKSADSFVDSIGVNVKLGYADTPYGDFVQTRAKLQELGVRHVRDGAPPASDTAAINRINALGSVGIKYTAIFVPVNDGLGPADSVLNRLNAIKTSVAMVEGPNEPDHGFTFNGHSFPRSAIDYQNVLWSAVKGDSRFSAFPVIAPSISFPPNSSQIQGMEYVANFGNTHSYHGARPPETTEVNLGLDNFYLPYAQLQTRNKPVIATETGNPTTSVNDPTLWMPQISIHAQGRYALRTHLFYFNKGISRTFIHELVDEHGTTTGNPAIRNLDESNFGLYFNNWAAKPAATGIRGLTRLLGDPGTAFTPGTLNYSLSGQTANVQKTLLQKRDGRFYLVLWQAAQSYNWNTHQDIWVPDVSVTLTLPQAFSIKGFIPMDSNYNRLTTPYFSYSGLTSINLWVPDHPIIIELTPSGTSVSGSGSTL